MRIIIDTDKKSIKLESTTNLGEFYEKIQTMLPDGAWKEFSIEIGVIIMEIPVEKDGVVDNDLEEEIKPDYLEILKKWKEKEKDNIIPVTYPSFPPSPFTPSPTTPFQPYWAPQPTNDPIWLYDPNQGPFYTTCSSDTELVLNTGKYLVNFSE